MKQRNSERKDIKIWQGLFIIIGCLIAIGSISCYIIQKSTDINKSKIEKDNSEKKETEKDVATPTPEMSAVPEVIYTLNAVGRGLMQNITYFELINCTNSSGDCGNSCTNSQVVKLSDPKNMEEIISHIQTGTQISELPDLGFSMEFCGGIKMNFYYNDDTYSSLWFATRKHLVLNINAPVSGGAWKSTQYYQFDSEDLYNYLIAKYTQLKI